ncbi:MAG TPA: hypothetical protein VKV39_11875 [Candidatus Sulfotelmatobacter sp.]|nr:hypothetical protein [Candidatus Sulfotelmatobacter sp.]
MTLRGYHVGFWSVKRRGDEDTGDGWDGTDFDDCCGSQRTSGSVKQSKDASEKSLLMAGSRIGGVWG